MWTTLNRVVALLLLTLPILPAWTPVQLTSRTFIPRSRVIRCSASSPAFLTREDGKNGKLRKLLDARQISYIELPCIAAERLDGYSDLRDALATGGLGCVVLTSPEAATVFLDAWREAGEPALSPLATVGAGTSKILAGAGLSADFVPSKATGKVLASELPAPKDNGVVLYPASALAADTVEGGLQARGMSTRRIDTYTTVPAKWDDADLAKAKGAKIVTFASPSAVRVWAERAGTDAAAVCIGETSAAECRRVGFEEVRCPDSPGVESWADAIAAFYGVEA